jgi:hypothetical protein
MSLLDVVVFVDVVHSVYLLQRHEVYWVCMAFQLWYVCLKSV